MSWDAIGAIGQLLGSIAVFITLGYLAIQVRHARNEAGRALSQGRGEALRDLIAAMKDERMVSATLKMNAGFGVSSNPFIRALMDKAELSEGDAMLVFWNQIAWWNYFLQMIPKVDELSAMERAQFEVPIRGFFGHPGPGQLFLEHYVRPRGHPDAIRYIDNVLAQPG